MLRSNNDAKTGIKYKSFIFSAVGAAVVSEVPFMTFSFTLSESLSHYGMWYTCFKSHTVFYLCYFFVLPKHTTECVFFTWFMFVCLFV